MLKPIILMALTLLLLQGCSKSSVKQTDVANVTSTPSGATVYANTLKLGITPLQYDLYDAFPAGWKNTSYQAQGMLVIKRQDCEDYTLQISDYILSKPIHADLKCSAVNVGNTSPVKAIQKAIQNDVEHRLEKVDALYKKQRITEEEYHKTRERILNEL